MIVKKAFLTLLGMFFLAAIGFSLYYFSQSPSILSYEDPDCNNLETIFSGIFTYHPGDGGTAGLTSETTDEHGHNLYYELPSHISITEYLKEKAAPNVGYDPYANRKKPLLFFGTIHVEYALKNSCGSTYMGDCDQPNRCHGVITSFDPDSIHYPK